MPPAWKDIPDMSPIWIILLLNSIEPWLYSPALKKIYLGIGEGPGLVNVIRVAS